MPSASATVRLPSAWSLTGQLVSHGKSFCPVDSFPGLKSNRQVPFLSSQYKSVPFSSGLLGGPPSFAQQQSQGLVGLPLVAYHANTKGMDSFEEGRPAQKETMHMRP